MELILFAGTMTVFVGVLSVWVHKADKKKNI